MFALRAQWRARARVDGTWLPHNRAEVAVVMPLFGSPHQVDVKKAGWHSRGCLPHFDGRAIPQFITLRLFDSIPDAVVQRWVRELDLNSSPKDEIILQRRIEQYLDQGYGFAFMGVHSVAEMVQKELLHYD